MRILFLAITMSLFAGTTDEFDVTSGVPRRNWSLQKTEAGYSFHVRWFTTKESCEDWRKLFTYENSKCEYIK